jgi:ribosomal protein S18 acetylase RimI-like enzyme
MKIALRAASIEDAAVIAELFQRSFVDTFGHLYRAEDLREFLAAKTTDCFAAEIADDRFEFVVAEDSGEIAGYVKLGPPQLPVDTPPDTIELCQLYVLKAWHGSGVAAELMRRALAIIRRRGARHVQLSVYVDNHRARRFYERYGFRPVGSYDFMVGSHADEDLVLRHVVMQEDE